MHWHWTVLCCHRCYTIMDIKTIWLANGTWASIPKNIFHTTEALIGTLVFILAKLPIMTGQFMASIALWKMEGPFKIKQRIPPICMCRKPQRMLNSISQSTLTNRSMFLLVSWQAVHAPNEVPKHCIKLYDKSKQSDQQKVHDAMATTMDEGIKNITDLFIRHGLWNNTVMFFSTDNGGNTIHGASNHPLRGEKGTLYEGGIRGVAFVRGKGIKPGRLSNSLMHMTDIYPTVVALAQQNIKLREDPFKDYFKTLDGYDVWSAITEDTPSPRHELLVNIDPVTPVRGPSLYPDLYNTGIRSAIIHGPWKLITGYCKRPFDQPHDPPVFDPRIQKILNVQLFNIETDLEEHNNLFFNNTKVVKMLLKRLEYYSRDAVIAYYPPKSNNWNPPKLKGIVLPWIDNPSFFVWNENWAGKVNI